jgi:hypothetical protein
MNKIISIISIAGAICFGTTYCWQWPWVDNTKLFEELGKEWDRDVLDQIALDYQAANKREITRLEKMLSDPGSNFTIRELQEISLDSRWSQLRERQFRDKEIEEKGLQIVDKWLLDAKNGGFDQEFLLRRQRTHLDSFEKKLVERYGKNNAEDYWFPVQFKSRTWKEEEKNKNK